MHENVQYKYIYSGENKHNLESQSEILVLKNHLGANGLMHPEAAAC
jgi:hypothetical protein